MKVLLLHNVKKIGKQGEVKEVADGYANGFLLPKKLAKPATPDVLKQVKNQSKLEEKNTEFNKKEEGKLFNAIEGKSVTVKSKSNESGHLFATVGSKEVLVAIQNDLGVILEPDHIDLKEGIKDTGEYPIGISIGEHAGSITVVIVAS